ncbi:helix-turn-helix domain-containing protein [Clostridium kluyveri]|uniref:Helix-turn-helix domain-containing protein n=1 Tax=Clostridium kluyveri TaxID=1534 RepID=A0A1L5F2V1_CLOKL|nr:helix-turn-helix domain-containing protein [Clostridium kluyveri]APM37307.1 hypothetical protein BS101_00270 [Clostridium kluyveri]
MEDYKIADKLKHDNKKVILVTPIETMELLGVGRNTMYQDLLKRKDFPAFKIGTKYFVNAELLQKWADKECNKSR